MGATPVLVVARVGLDATEAVFQPVRARARTRHVPVEVLAGVRAVSVAQLAGVELDAPFVFQNVPVVTVTPRRAVGGAPANLLAPPVVLVAQVDFLALPVQQLVHFRAQTTDGVVDVLANVRAASVEHLAGIALETRLLEEVVTVRARALHVAVDGFAKVRAVPVIPLAQVDSDATPIVLPQLELCRTVAFVAAVQVGAEMRAVPVMIQALIDVVASVPIGVEREPVPALAPEAAHVVEAPVRASGAVVVQVVVARALVDVDAVDTVLGEDETFLASATKPSLGVHAHLVAVVRGRLRALVHVHARHQVAAELVSASTNAAVGPVRVRAALGAVVRGDALVHVFARR